MSDSQNNEPHLNTRNLSGNILRLLYFVKNSYIANTINKQQPMKRSM
jgi:hypothetical protein